MKQRGRYRRCVWTTALLTAAILGTVAGCGDRRHVPAYADTLALFSPEAPGYGADVSCTSELHDQPKAYCLYASAEARRFAATREPAALANAMRAADWLVENADLDDDGVIGWGLPFAWDAGGDGTANPPDTEYAIQTAQGIQALLDVTDAARSRPSSERCTAYVQTALGAARSYATKFAVAVEDGLVFFYSSQAADAYHVLNVTAMLAGQLQRLSQRVPAAEAAALAALADGGIGYILSRTRLSEGIPYWHYYGDVSPSSVGSDRPNDLQHESYVIQGLLDYKLHGGRLAGDIELRPLLATLRRFLVGTKVFAFPQDLTDATQDPEVTERWADLWRVGYALHVAVRLEDALHADHALSATLAQTLYSEYRTRNGAWLIRPDHRVSCSYPRQRAFVLLGLSFYEHACVPPDT